MWFCFADEQSEEVNNETEEEKTETEEEKTETEEETEQTEGDEGETSQNGDDKKVPKIIAFYQINKHL